MLSTLASIILTKSCTVIVNFFVVSFVAHDQGLSKTCQCLRRNFPCRPHDGRGHEALQAPLHLLKPCLPNRLCQGGVGNFRKCCSLRRSTFLCSFPGEHSALLPLLKPPLPGLLLQWPWGDVLMWAPPLPFLPPEAAASSSVVDGPALNKKTAPYN